MLNPLFKEDCRKAYLEACLGFDWPEELEPRTVYDCVRASWEQAIRDIIAFMDAAAAARVDVEAYDAEQVGHDLWLTRNGHGVGFWDRPKIYGEKEAEKLTEIASAMGQRYPYHIAGRWWGISF